jgi:hypothetical protein
VELKWRAEGQVAAPALRLLVQASSIDKGWPGLTITALPHNSTGGTVPFEVRAETVVRIWSVARSGRLSLSDAKTWHYASNPP